MRQEHLSVPDIPEGLPLFLWINRILFFTMRAIMKLLICCVFMLFLVNVVPAAGSTTELLSCCFQQLGNRSVVYILNNTVESDFTQWTRNKTPIKDEHGNVDKSIVIGYGQNWITLNQSYLDIVFYFQTYDMMKNQEVQCTDLCEPGSANLPIGEKHETNQRDGGDGGTGLNTAGKAGIGVSVFIFIVIGVICGIQCYRKIGRF
ncbi:uncharacterized protein LOC108263836 isoform X1 [Ictalurus punctatus]|uniref:Uncharacterized protein LOC108263836 isoform X1 n=1 Tax=Ictalurus punctatus TaxID=7998 RepID=A0A2D0QQB5_ICTPU|nr:uncharacterized protein LOC108263836 isoform X1 [Ictalurus punctatus]